MTDILKELASLGAAYMNVAREAYPKGAVLSCSVCGARQVVLTTDCARYIARGWPVCHGQSVNVEAIP